LKVVFTDVDQWCEDEYQEGSWLSEETGWWYPDGRILVYKPGNSFLQRIGIAVHECLEYIMIMKLNWIRNISHFIANVFEFVISLGTANQSWARQVWKK